MPPLPLPIFMPERPVLSRAYHWRLHRILFLYVLGVLGFIGVLYCGIVSLFCDCLQGNTFAVFADLDGVEREALQIGQ